MIGGKIGNMNYDSDRMLAEEYWIKKIQGAEYSQVYTKQFLNNNKIGSITSVIPEDLQHRINSVTKGDGKSKFVLFCAALALIHYYYTRNNNVLINSPQLIFDTDDLDLEVKLFYHLKIDEEQSLSEIVKQSRSEFEQAYLHRDYNRASFMERVSGQVNPDLLIQTGLRVKDVNHCEDNHSESEINFEFPGDDRLIIFFNAGKFDPAMVRQYANHFLLALHEMVFNGKIKVKDLDLVMADERDDLLLRFNDSLVPLSTNTTIVDLVETACNEHPGYIAIKTLSGGMTFGQLKEYSDRLASHLINNYELKEEAIISILLERSEWVIVSILGILKAGYAFLPIDSGYPAAHIEYLINDSQSPVIITDEQHADLMEQRDCILVSQLKTLPVGDTFNKSRSNGLAHVIYTSGSTGKPKGVLVEHAGLLNHINWFTGQFGINPSDSTVLISSYSWDGVYSIIWSSLVKNATLHIIPTELVIDPPYLLQYIAQNGITYLKMAPSFFAAMVSNDFFETTFESWHLRFIMLGGEKVNVGYLRKYFLKYPDTLLANHYGATEASIGSAFQLISNETLDSFAELPVIGSPYNNCEVYVVGRDMNLLPVGAVGEICLGGVGVARGYLGKEQLTAQKFLDNPFKPGRRLYRTGDFGYWTCDGKLVFKGREDFQVKVRGYRIELAEIELALQKYPDVSEARVMLFEIAEGRTELTAFIRSPQQPDIAGLRNYLKSNLPEFMIPAEFIQLDKIPFNLNGKLDTAELKKHLHRRMITGSAYVAPATKEEIVLTHELGKIFNREQISIKDDFFVLGGDSIKAILLSSRMRQNKYTINIKDILLYPKIEELAARLKYTGDSAQDYTIVEGLVGLNPIQRRFLEEEEFPKDHFNQSIFLFSRERIDRNAIANTLKHIINHHDALRSVFKKKENGWSQKITGPVSEVEIDERILDAGPSWKISLNQYCEQTQSGINLENGPLLKCSLFHCPDGDRLLIVIHHLVVDGVAWRILLEDFSILLGQYKNNATLRLSSKTCSIKLWQQQLEKYANSNDLVNETGYWKKLESFDAKIKKDEDFAVNFYKDAKEAGFSISRELTNLLLTKCYSPYRADINDILLTALGLAIKKIFDVKEIPVMLEGHGREYIGADLDISRTIGWFTAKYPVLLDMTEEKPEDCLVNVKEHLHRIPNKGIGYGILRYISNDAGLQGNVAEPEISFNYLGDFGPGVAVESDQQIIEFCEDYRGHEQDGDVTRKELIAVSAIIVNDSLRVSVSYSKKQFLESTIYGLINEFELRLIALVKNLGTLMSQSLTPVDLSYKGLSVKKLNSLNAANNIEDIYPLSPLQQGFYYQWLAGVSERDYFEQIIYKIKDKNFDIGLLNSSYQFITRHHSILRTHFISDKGVPLQVVEKSSVPQIYFRDVSGDGTFSIERVCEEDKKKGFDLSAGSQMRLAVYYLGDDEYYYVWSHHHIIMDGWCINVIIGEFYSAFKSLAEGITPEPGKSRPYSGYIEWLNKIDIKSSLGYWKNYLNGFSSATGIPKQIKGPGKKVYDEIDFELDETHINKIRNTCKTLGVTDHNFIQALWGLVVAKYSNSDDVVFGSVVSGRPGDLDGVETMIGLFINTIPVRVRVNQQVSVEEFVKDHHRQSIESLGHHYIQLAEILSGHDLGNHLFDHLFIYQNYPFVDLSKLVYDLSSVQVLSAKFTGQTNYPLCIVVAPYSDRLLMRISYDSSVYSAKFIQQVGDHFLALLNNAAIAANISLIELPFLSAAEHKKLLFEFNSVPAYQQDLTIINVFEKQVQQAPDAFAVINGDEALSYKELNHRSNQLAHYLRSIGAKKGTFVLVLAQPGIEMIIGLLAILKTGAAYVPVDPSYSTERLNNILKETRATIVLSGEQSIKYLPLTFNGVIVRLNDDWDKVGVFPISNFNEKIAPGDKAFVLYTQGAGLNARGIITSHKNVARLFNDFTNLLGSDEVLLLTHSYSSGISVLEIYGALFSGSTLVVIETALADDPLLLKEKLEAHKVTALIQSPRSFTALQKLLVHTDTTLSIDKIILTGAAFYSSVSEAWSQKYPHCKLINVYGSVETNYYSTHKKISKQQNDLISNIGRPASFICSYILDHNRHLLPIGVPGELYLSGDGIASEYLGHDGLTPVQTTDNLYGEHKLYRTGDMARWMDNGDLEFLGSVKRLTKVRNWHIDLREIENTILQIENIDSCCVTKDEGPGNNQQLIAFIVVNGLFDRESFFEFLESRLPGYMIPYTVQVVPFIPLTENGEAEPSFIGRQLMQFSASHSNGQAATELENELKGIWQNLLGSRLSRQSIHSNDDFFSIGGHSLLAIRLAVLYAEKFNVHLEIKELLRSRTIEKHVLLISEKMQSGIHSIPVAEFNESYPVSEAQKRIWMQSKFSNASAAYNLSACFEIIGELNTACFEKAVSELVLRHESLRTVFRSNANDEVVQVIHTPKTGENILTITKFNTNEIATTDISDYLYKVLNEPFDLENGPLFRIGILQIDSNKCILHYAIHHIVTDGWSMNIIQKELMTLYGSLLKGNAAPFAPLRIQYKDFAVWQQKLLNEEFINSDKAYWLRKCSGELPILDLPYLNQRPGIRTYDGRIAYFEFEPQTFKALGQLSGEYEGTMFITVMAIVYSILSRYTGQTDIIVGSPLAGREDPELQAQVGFYVNILPLRVTTGNEDNFKSLFKQVKETVLDAIEHQNYPFNRLVDDLKCRRDTSRSPLFDVVVTYNSDNAKTVEEYGGIVFKNIPHTDNERILVKYDLAFDFYEIENRLGFSISYNSNLFESHFVSRIANHLLNFSSRIAVNPFLPVSQIDFLDATEKNLLLSPSDQNGKVVSNEDTIIHLFKKQVENAGHAIAVTCGNETMSYADLDSRSNRVANFLVKNLLTKGSVVAINLPRGIDYIVSIFGILKAGGCYLPLDPNYPVERINYCINDCGADFLITAAKSYSENKFETAKIILLDQNEELDHCSDLAPQVSINGNDLAYIIYTSGTTGKPKGVMVEHGNVVSLLNTIPVLFQINIEDVWTQFHSYSFDFSVWEIFGALTSGGKVVVVPEQATKDPGLLLKLLVREKVTVLCQTPPMFYMFIDHLKLAGLLHTNLRYIIFGGEALQPGMLSWWHEKYPGVKNINMYGITETTVHVTFKEIGREEINSNVSSIGKALPGLDCFILDDYLNPLPTGAIGQLFVGGSGVARGYFGRDELTGQRFISNTFYTKSRLYKTGDKARFLSNGEIQYLGRVDDQVKIRGHRIEPGEVQSMLLKYEAIRAAAVIAIKGDEGNELAAFYTSDSIINKDALKTFLKSHVPSYMLPSLFLQVDEIPVTVNGKINKRELTEIGKNRTDIISEIAVPQNEMEEKLVAIWKSILGIASVGVDQNFFSLGGHSLKAIRLQSEIHKEFGIKLDLEKIFNAPTISELSAEIMDLIWISETIPENAENSFKVII